MNWTALLALCIWMGCAGAAQAPAAAPQTAKPLDGNWWRAASSSERLGYLEGDNDCHSFEFGGLLLAASEIPLHQDFVSKFYDADAARLRTPAFEVLRRADAQIAAAPDKDADASPAPHGDYDGLFWRDTRRDERIGFTEGYLACYARKTDHRRGSFSKSADEYVKLLDAWYQLSERERNVDPKIENAKVGDVIFRFRDRERRAWLHPW